MTPEKRCTYALYSLLFLFFIFIFICIKFCSIGVFFLLLGCFYGMLACAIEIESARRDQREAVLRADIANLNQNRETDLRHIQELSHEIVKNQKIYSYWEIFMNDERNRFERIADITK